MTVSPPTVTAVTGLLRGLGSVPQGDRCLPGVWQALVA